MPIDESNGNKDNADYGFLMEAFGRTYYPLPQKYIQAVVDTYNKASLPLTPQEDEVEITFEEYIRIKHRVTKYYYLALYLKLYV